MKFEVTISSSGPSKDTQKIVMDNANWLEAFQSVLVQNGLNLESKGLQIVMYDDYSSAHITDPSSLMSIDISSYKEDLSEMIPELQDDEIFEVEDEVDHEFRDIPAEDSHLSLSAIDAINISNKKSNIIIPCPSKEDLPAFIQSSITKQTFSESGLYQPGKTADFLTDAFMKVTNLYSEFPNEEKKAFDFVLDVLSKIDLDGSGIMVTYDHSEESVLSCVSVRGRSTEALIDVQIPLNQGAIGFSFKHGVPLRIDHLGQYGKFSDDILLTIPTPVASFLCAPIQSQENEIVRGVLFFFRQVEKPFTQGEEGIIAYIASALGNYIELNKN